MLKAFDLNFDKMTHVLKKSNFRQTFCVKTVLTPSPKFKGYKIFN